VRIDRTALIAALTLALGGSLAQTAAGEGPVGANPRSNYPIGSLPGACWTAPTGRTCLRAGISILNRARAHMDQPNYVLPRGFVSLTPAEQAFVLTNLDRLRYGLSPVPGLTAGLDRAAAAGVRAQNDPQPAGGWDAYTSNWAGGYPNIVLAYEGWMYDDGPGSGNLDCTAANRAGCWGHRHDILWRFAPDGPLAMGAAARMASGGRSSYAMLLEQERPGTHLRYVYRWAQAVRAGARG
jgi:hypothetical protein